MKSSEVRDSFLEFFEKHDHRIVPSSSLVPIDDPTLLFTNAGMNQFKLVFTGEEKRPYSRAASSQKCIRAGGKHNDLENVGLTARHHTFFEMLGNFSFGDYFKADAIKYAWKYVTGVLGLPKDRIWASIYEEDDEAYDLWLKIVPEMKGRVLRFDEKENYWAMGDTGPCGPCSELHFDRGERFGTGPQDVVNGESERFVEIWNLVFMQFERDESGHVTPLPKPSIDTGAGLERMTCVLQDVETNYETDLFMPVITAIEDLCGKKYDRGDSGTSFRVISDHIRALTFAFSDGAVPSNEGRGYVLRRILRRAARHGRLLGLKEPFLCKLTAVVREIMSGGYPELETKAPLVTELLRVEEERFNETLDNGLALFDRVAGRLASEGSDTIPGEDVFKLCDTYGFPPDLTEVMARERGLNVDMGGFESCMAVQKQRSREAHEARGVSFEGVAIDEDAVSDFRGYDDSFELRTTVAEVKPLKNGLVAVILESTPFYAESGGQIGDTGTIGGDSVEFEVTDTQKEGSVVLHIGHDPANRVSVLVGKTVVARVDGDRQKATQRNHTATHLLHKALREVLGEHVEQAGSLVEPTRFRFDFSHFKAMTPEEISEVERIVNEQIMANHPVNWRVTGLNEAKAAGAMALFGEKYGERVRMVEIDDYSRELCGGTHVQNTGEIGLFVITQESAIAAGMRRIEATTGASALEYVNSYRESMQAVSNALKSAPNEVYERVVSLTQRVKEQHKEIQKIRQSRSDVEIKSAIQELKSAGDVHYATATVQGREQAQQYLDNVKNDDRKVVIGLKDNSNYFIVASKAAAKSGLTAMNVIKVLNKSLDGRGGGKDTFAQGGTKKHFELDEMEGIIREALAG
jgi:alanyl-tRNA synthetase